MTKEEKQLLLIDLCARLPYGVKLNFYSEATNQNFITTLLGIEPDSDTPIIAKVEDDAYTFMQGHVKPYLRPMSSMTEEEKKEYDKFYFIAPGQHLAVFRKNCERRTDWLNEHHFDYRGLIPMGLALEAPEGMYKTE